MICSTKSRAKIFMWLSNSCITACFQFSWYFDYNPTRQLILFYSSPHRLFTFSSCSRIQARLKACSWQTIWLVSYDYEFITVWIYLFSWPKGQKVSLTFFHFDIALNLSYLLTHFTPCTCFYTGFNSCQFILPFLIFVLHDWNLDVLLTNGCHLLCIVLNYADFSHHS